VAVITGIFGRIVCKLFVHQVAVTFHTCGSLFNKVPDFRWRSSLKRDAEAKEKLYEYKVDHGRCFTDIRIGV
jgi:hypothetical protein